MVFFDPTGIRKFVFWSATAALFVLCAGFSTLAYAALVNAPQPEKLAYDHLPGGIEKFEKTIALTFDDGPDPIYTRTLIEYLKQEDVPATFFLIGEQVVRYPETARYIVDSGFEIGNHTFTHSEHVNNNEQRLRNEVIATDRVIRDATGYRALMFRPPYLEDIDVGEFDGGLIDGDEIRWAENAGFIVVGANLDTQDWNVAAGDSATILARLEERMPDERPVVIIMHEHAGAGATIEALKSFIPEKKAEGYRFVFVSEYFGLMPGQAMPAAESSALDYALVIAAKVFALVPPAFNALIMFVSVLGLSRLWLIVASRRALVYIKSPRRVQTSVSELHLSIPTTAGTLFSLWPMSSIRSEPVTVIIPAYNEAANIEATIQSIMASTVSVQIVVIDDGSTDDTATIVRRLQKKYDTITLLQKENSGSKASALNYGLEHSTGNILVSIDGDTIIEPQTIQHLLWHFEDAKVGAVAGKIYPATTNTLLEKFQYLEYMQGQNLEKHVFARGNAIGVVPGAIGAWRRSAIIEAGGYSTETVVEDQDLTLTLLALGWTVRFEPAAIAYTETPSTLKGFYKQRSRWVYGTMQCAWKHRYSLFSLDRPALGWIILPNLLMFNLFIPLLVPFIDGAVILGLLGWMDMSTVLIPFLIYTLFDFWCAVEGVAPERFSAYKLIPLVLWQRFFYRYMLAVTIIRSAVLALRGSFMRWGTQERRGECHPSLKEMNAFSPASTLSVQTQSAPFEHTLPSVSPMVVTTTTAIES